MSAFLKSPFLIAIIAMIMGVSQWKQMVSHPHFHEHGSVQTCQHTAGLCVDGSDQIAPDQEDGGEQDANPCHKCCGASSTAILSGVGLQVASRVLSSNRFRFADILPPDSVPVGIDYPPQLS